MAAQPTDDSLALELAVPATFGFYCACRPLCQFISSLVAYATLLGKIGEMKYWGMAELV
jgi:hypothetical protein